MPQVTIQPADLQIHDPSIETERGRALIETAMAQAVYHAPCLEEASFEHDAYAKGIIVQAIVDRAHRGDRKTTTTGPFSQTRDTRPRAVPTDLLPQSVIDQLRSMCGQVSGGALPRATFPPKPRDLFGPL